MAMVEKDTDTRTIDWFTAEGWLYIVAPPPPRIITNKLNWQDRHEAEVYQIGQNPLYPPPPA